MSATSRHLRGWRLPRAWKTRGPRWCASGLLITACLFASPVDGETFVVNSTLDTVDASPGNGVCATAGGVCTLRAAIQEANRLSGTHVITLPAGTYVLAIAGSNESAAATGDLNIATGKNITINGASAATTIIDANRIDRAFESTGGNLTSLTLNDLTVQNGAPTRFGGCFYMSTGAQLTLTRVVVKNCRASTFGGSGVGGAFYIFFGSILTLTDTTIAQNVSDTGGAIAIGHATATMNRTTISGNSAGSGGGIFSDSPSAVTLTNSTISGNIATDSGGAMYFQGNSGSSLTLANVTIASNSSGRLGAVRMINAGLYKVKNSIIANSTDSVGAASANCSTSNGGLITDLGNNLEFPGTACGFSLASARRADPLLGALANNGGATQTHALGAGSPAIDAGDPATCLAPPVSGVDQRGFARPAACDIGAYEAGGIAPTPPGVPTGLTASSSGSSVTLTWSAPASGTAPDTYVIEAGSASGLADLANVSTGTAATTFFATGVARGTYYVRVRAGNAVGISGPSNEVLLTVGTGGCTAAPGPPTNLAVVSVTGGTVLLTWTAAPGTPTSYVVEAGSSPGGSNLATTDLGSTATSLTAPGVGRGTYYLRIRGRNACGLGTASNEVTFVVP